MEEVTMAHQNPDLHKKEETKGLQIIIWTNNPTTPTLAFHNCRNINDAGHMLRFTYDGLSTGKTSTGRFDKRSIVGYAIEVPCGQMFAHQESIIENSVTNAVNDVANLGKTTNKILNDNLMHDITAKVAEDLIQRGGL